MSIGFENNIDTWSGAGSSSNEELGVLLKALEANPGVTDSANLTDVGALMPQSLDSTLKLLTFQEKHLSLWKAIPKGIAYSTVEEYNIQDGYGSGSSWVGEMETPEERDPTASREFSQVKFQRDMWKISDISGIVRAVTNTEVWAKNASTLRLLRSINTTLYSGDSAIVGEQIDGFEKAITGNGSSDHIKDLRGATPTENDFRELTELINSNYGDADGAKLFCSPGGMTTLDQVLFNSGSGTQRYSQGVVNSTGGISIGSSVSEIRTRFGTIIPTNDIFLAGEYESREVPKIKVNKVIVEGKTSVRSPDSPTFTLANAGATTGSLWIATGTRPASGAQTYEYRVAAGNRFGLSQAAAAKASPALAAGEANTVTITPGPNSIFPATYFEIYSEKADGDGEFRFIERIAASSDPTTVYTDLNAFIPGTTRMFLLDLSGTGEGQTFSYKMLAPLHSVQYARIGAYKWGTVAMYGTAQHIAPLRYTMLKNVDVGVESKSSLLAI